MLTDFAQIVAGAVVNGDADAVLATDGSGSIRFWNPGAERIFGHTASEAMGQSLDIIIPERLRARHWAGFQKVMKSGQSRYGAGDLLSVPAIRKDGHRISVEFTVLPLKGADGTMIGVAAVMRDVSKKYEELQSLKRQVSKGGPVGKGSND